MSIAEGVRVTKKDRRPTEQTREKEREREKRGREKDQEIAKNNDMKRDVQR